MATAPGAALGGSHVKELPQQYRSTDSSSGWFREERRSRRHQDRPARETLGPGTARPRNGWWSPVKQLRSPRTPALCRPG